MLLGTEIILKNPLPESPYKCFVNKDDKLVLTDCCKAYSAANFGKGSGENLFFARKRFSLGNRQGKMDSRAAEGLRLAICLGIWYDEMGKYEI